MRSRRTCPSVAGLNPRLEFMIAFSTACTMDLSQTCTLSSRGSGTLTVARVERHVGAVGVDLHRIEHAGGCAAGAQPAELLLEDLDRALHAALDFVEVVVRGRHLTSPQHPAKR